MDLGFWAGKKVFITGHTGFKGSWLTKILIDLGALVSGFSLPPDSTPNLFTLLNVDELCVHSTFSDISNLNNLSDCINSFEPQVCFHLAAQPLVRESYRDPLGTFQTNVMGTANLLQALRQSPSCKTCIVITTDKCYAPSPIGAPHSELDKLGGDDPYSASKACVELIAHSYRESYFSRQQLAISTARAGNVIGGGDWSNERLITDIVRHIWENKSLSIRNPNSVRPWQHVLDASFGYLALAESTFHAPDLQGAWNFGPSLLEPRFTVYEVLNAFNVSHSATFEDSTHLMKETNLLSLNPEKSATMLSWENRLSTPDSIKLTSQWYSSFYNNGDIHDITSPQISTYVKDLLNV